MGLGTIRLDRLIDRARAGPWDRLRLDTSCHSPALPLFRRRGFAEIPRYNADPLAQAFMELALSP